MATNNFLPFAPTDTGTNLLTQGEYAVASDRSNGNQPGVASSKLVNKAMRQSAFITSQFAQFVADKTGADLTDDANTARLLAQINMAIKPFAPAVTSYLSGSGTHYATFIFGIATGSATAGATYTNNTFTFTVKETVAAGVEIKMTGTGVPEFSGVLTKSAGTGDATLTFYARRAPISLDVLAVGGGGGGGGGSGSSSSNAGAGGAGGNTTFGSSLITANGGAGAVANGLPGSGGAATVTAPAVGIGILGSAGGPGLLQASASEFATGGSGGPSALGGQGAGGYPNGVGGNGSTNSGGGGGGGTPNGGTANYRGGSGGGSGAFIQATIPVTSTVAWAYAVGTGGTAGAAGTNGLAGGAGAAGIILVRENFQ